MTKEQYQSIHLADLRGIAKSRGMKRISTMKKAELIEAMLALDTRGADSAENMPDFHEQNRSAILHEQESDPAPAEQEKFSEIKELPASEAGKQTETADSEQVDDSGKPENGKDRPASRKVRSVRLRKESSKRKDSRQGDRQGQGDHQNQNPRSRAKNGRENRKADEHVSEDRNPEEKRQDGQKSARSQNRRTGRRPKADTMRRQRDENVRVDQEKRDSEDQAEKKVTEEKKIFRENRQVHEENSYAEERDSADRSISRETNVPVSERETHAGSGSGDAEIPEEIKPGLPNTGLSSKGILEVMPDGFGFLRTNNYLSGEDDVYVSPSQIRRFNLRTGDELTGIRRARGQGEKYGALLFVSTVNGFSPDAARKRDNFETMTPIFPNERIRLEREDGSRATRIVDLISPIGKGQRGMIVSPPKAGKTTLLKDIAKSILLDDPATHLIILLIDERPEEVTDMKETIHGEHVDIVFSTFDEQPEHHRRVAEMVMERAKRLVEHHEDVIILLDSITRLARANNVLVPPSGRTLSGGIDPTALYMPKKFFGAARNMREGGSLTILATALVDTGSKMDDVIYEEFKGTGNMELVLNRKLQERRIFPAIDIVKSGTRREDLLLSPKELRAVTIMRRHMNGLKAEESVESILNAFARYPSNDMVVQAVLTKWQ